MGCVLLCLVALLAGHVNAEGERKVNDAGMGRSCTGLSVCASNSSSVCPQFQKVIKAISLKLLHFLPVYTIQSEVCFVDWSFRTQAFVKRVPSLSVTIRAHTDTPPLKHVPQFSVLAAAALIASLKSPFEKP